MDHKYPKPRVGSRLPRMNVSTGAPSDGSRSHDSGIPRLNKPIHSLNNNHNNYNHNDLNHKRSLIGRKEDLKSADNRPNHNKSMNQTMDSFDEKDCPTSVDTNRMKTTTSLCKSQSLNEIQYQNSEYLSKVSALSNGCDSQKAFSFEQLDEELANLKTYSSDITKDKMNSDLNLMSMSIEESSTASLGLLPHILSSMSPLDTFNQNIPFVSIESDFVNENHIKLKNDTNLGVKEDDDDSENGIPVIQEDESDPDTTITNASEPPLTSVVAINETNDSNNSSDNTMEGICCGVGPEVAQESGSRDSDNCMTLKSNTDNESMSTESIGDNLIRPNSLQTRDSKPMIASEKIQRAASPSAKAPVRKKFKTPGRWDAVMTKIEKSKTCNANNTNNNNTLIKGKISANIHRNAATNGSLPQISPSDELSVADDNHSSHLSPSCPSVKSTTTSSTAKKIVVNASAAKVNIPKSKTFVRDSNGNQSTGNTRSQQPVATPKSSIAATPVTPQQPPTTLLCTEKSGSQQTIRRDRVLHV
ncbi:unnamed protein product [Oppiella nova]|uniref:Uncharacterized protein n=1 Tax=Oppiella nova TaxID=334625 RepID=A0A7R9LBM3_9ACAR|nr:unnamed protein product [Oppiella nova]CAG2161947.1 unnamed protein product [Oppiella nova]